MSPSSRLVPTRRRSKKPNPKTLQTVLTEATQNNALAKVDLTGVDRELLIKRIPDFTYVFEERTTTFAHQFGRHSALERIQPLLRAGDYDLEINDAEFGAHEPPLYAFVISEQAIKLLPTKVFSADRLFRRLEPDGGSVWIRALIFNELAHYIPRECLSKDNLLTKYNPSEGPRTPFADILASEQAQGIYPTIVSADDIKASEAFPNIVARLMACPFTTCLKPEEFVSHYTELKDIWTTIRDDATPEAARWFGEVAKARLKASMRG